MPEQVVTYKGRTFSIVLLLIIGVLAILLWWKSCGGSKAENPVVAKLKVKLSQDSLRRMQEKKDHEELIKVFQGQLALQQQINDDKEKNLGIMSKEIDRLRADHAKEPAPIPFDSNSAIVSNRWISQCDTCFSLLKRGQDSVQSLLKSKKETEITYRKIWAEQTNRIVILEENANRDRANYNDLLKRYEKDTKPKASLSGGIEYGYSQPVSNIGVYLTFRSRSGKEFSLSGGGNTLSHGYLMGRIGMKIF